MNRILKCKEKYRDWNTFVFNIGLPELAHTTEDDLESMIVRAVPKTHYRYFESLPERDNKLLINVIPTGAGSSFLGAIQQVARGEINLDLSNRKFYLWDDEFGLNSLNKKQTITDFYKLEEIYDKVMDRTSTWDNLWGTYVSLVSTITDTQEVTVHTWPATFDFFIETELYYFIDMDWNKFAWCYFLASIKHSGNDGWNKKIREDFREGNISRLSNLILIINKAWKIFKLCRQHTKKKYILQYKDLIEEQDYNTVKRFLQGTVGADTSDSTVTKCQDLLKKYHNANLELMKDWNKVKDQIWSQSWQR